MTKRILILLCACASLSACAEVKSGLSVLTHSSASLPLPGPTPLGTPQPDGTPVPDDKIIVYAEKATHVAYDIIVAVEKLEYENRAFVLTHIPQVHVGVEALRRNAKKDLQLARSLLATYKLTRNPATKVQLMLALTKINIQATEAQSLSSQIQNSTP